MSHLATITNVKYEDGEISDFDIDFDCDEPETALCRNGSDCDCESYFGVVLSEGVWYHEPESGEGEFHAHTKSQSCNIVTWLENDDHTDRDDIREGRHFIDVDWHGEGYDWWYMP